MGCGLLRCVLLLCVLGCCAAAQAEPPTYRYQGVGTGLWVVRADTPSSEAPVAKLELLGEVGPILQVGPVLYAVYAKQYLVIFDISRPTQPLRLTTLSVDADIERLYLGTGEDRPLLVVLAGATAAYSLADPRHPAPLLGSPPWHPVSDAQERADAAERTARRYRDYQSVHPMIPAGIVIAVIGGVMVGASIPPLLTPRPSDKVDLAALVAYPLAMSGGVHIAVGAGLLINGIYQQVTDKRPRRPASSGPAR